MCSSDRRIFLNICKDFMGLNLQIFKSLTLRAIAQSVIIRLPVHIVAILLNYQKDMWKYSFKIRKKKTESV